MRLSSLIVAVRRILGKDRVIESPAASETEDDELDPVNPFPEVVVIEFKDSLDLHSIPPSYLKAVVEGYLEQARERGARRVRIIHGKGIGVQREMVRKILQRCPFVESFGDAPAELGGWGATIVNLAFGPGLNG